MEDFKASNGLEEIDWRLLHWMLRYPLQRADDLVVGVVRWASRATVYRHLRGLEAGEFVESVLPKTPGEGERLYHVSNLGLQCQRGTWKDQPANSAESGRRVKWGYYAGLYVFPRCSRSRRW